MIPENFFSSIPECHSAWRAFMPEVAESIADSNRFCDSAFGLRAEWQHCLRFRKFQWEWKKDSFLYLWGKFYSIGFTFLCSSGRSGEWSVFGYFSSHCSPGYRICTHKHHLSPQNFNVSAQIQHLESEQEIMLSQIGRKDDFIGAP